jgi:hypothetical protein
MPWGTSANCVGFEVLTAAVVKTAIFWDIAPCNLYVLSHLLLARFLLSWYSTLKMEVIRSSETPHNRLHGAISQQMVTFITDFYFWRVHPVAQDYYNFHTCLQPQLKCFLYYCNLLPQHVSDPTGHPQVEHNINHLSMVLSMPNGSVVLWLSRHVVRTLYTYLRAITIWIKIKFKN